MFKFVSSLLDSNKKEVDRLSKIADKVNSYEAKSEKFKEEDFAKKTGEFKKRIQKGEELLDLLPEAFALAKEASSRAIGLKPYDVQIMAAAALFEGKVAEQKTGEGKTLSAVPALYLHALLGKGVHLVTVNDYLARRDAGWNGPTFKLLGLTTGAIVQENKSFVYDPVYSDTSHGDERLSHLRPVSRKEAYQADVTYGTNNEFGFDYLRDNMVSDLSEAVQARGHYFAIVDEVDSVLIDEARTPLIISAPDTEPTQRYFEFAKLIDKLSSDTDYLIDEKLKSASLTEHGITKVEKTLGVENLYEKDFETIHHIENALRARTLYLRDRDYVVKDNQVIIVDEFTGRLMIGRRWSDGLHQAVEAKEGVQIQQESKTLATISFQNYFRMYEILSGMTGTAVTEAEEFHKIYKLGVVEIPTHRPMVRKNHSDVIYKTLRAKYTAVVDEIVEMNKAGRPVLVGTTSIEKNEIISEYLKRKKVPHQVLNAKQHEREAIIIAEAGERGAVTVATNMAGRGVDIILGGSPPDKPGEVSSDKFEQSDKYKKWRGVHEEIVKLGGLHVIGTERHEARRIDNQLRGRSGRQGDPGSSRFYLSLEDDLMRIFGGERIASLMNTLKIPEDQPIENSLVSKAIESAQTKVEGFHFDARKHLVEMDDVANEQREIIYSTRKKILEAEDVSSEIRGKLSERIDSILESGFGDGGEVNSQLILGEFLEIIPFDSESQKRISKRVSEIRTKDEMHSFLESVAKSAVDSREKQVGKEATRQIEKFAYLSAIDRLWIDHIDNIEDLRESIGLRAYGQRDPIVEFKNEAYGLFEKLLDKIDNETLMRLFRIQVAQAPRPTIPTDEAVTNVDKSDSIGLAGGVNQDALVNSVNQSTSQPGAKHKLGRNDPCPCGSGKKWKKCHYPQLG